MTTPTPKSYPIPANADRARCRACGHAIAFIFTEKGKRMPVNLAGDKQGQSHFATCSDPKRFRKRDRVASKPGDPVGITKGGGPVLGAGTTTTDHLVKR
jgi:hypothetical protein